MTAPVLMVLGTMSGVGKSAITAGLCRILHRRGYRVAPFKAQNMSLNAAVTPDGGEIGRSTAVQAAAAGIEPTVDMNPILLKPEPGMRSQVILRGKVSGRLAARDYVARTPDFWPTVAESLGRLRDEYDVVVAEGAGSPAELNLRERDLVNMRVALHAGAAVMLVGDIERGGVFAQLVGTLNLLAPAERALVRGLIVNKFRGDPSLFDDGVRILVERTGVPVLGVVPFQPDIDLAEEDSAALAARPPRSGAARPGDVRIAVIRLPHLSNFDEFGPLERAPGVALDYVTRPTELADADLVILPGSKATIADLGFVRERGLAEALVAARARGTPILGICGGYQMLGRTIHDPDHVEAAVDAVAGLGLLDHDTTFAPDKLTARVRARFEASDGPFATLRGVEVDGYEIHAGRSASDLGPRNRLLRVVRRGGRTTDHADGAISADGLVLGTYVHGLFDSPAVVRALVGWLRRRAYPTDSIPSGTAPPAPDPYDRWADVLEGALDVPAILAMIDVAPR